MKIDIINPIKLWTDLKPKTKMFIIGCFTAIIITSMITGYFDEIMRLLGYEEMKK